jgi:hypothetical protein
MTGMLRWVAHGGSGVRPSPRDGQLVQKVTSIWSSPTAVGRRDTPTSASQGRCGDWYPMHTSSTPKLIAGFEHARAGLHLRRGVEADEHEVVRVRVSALMEAFTGLAEIVPSSCSTNS